MIDAIGFFSGLFGGGKPSNTSSSDSARDEMDRLERQYDQAKANRQRSGWDAGAADHRDSGGAGSTSRREQREAEKAARQEEAQKQERTADRKKSPNDLVREKEMKADLDKEANANRSYLGPVKEKPQPTYTKEDVAEFQAIADRQNRVKENRAGGLMNPSMRAEMDAREAERQKSNEEFGKVDVTQTDTTGTLGKIKNSPTKREERVEAQNSTDKREVSLVKNDATKLREAHQQSILDENLQVATPADIPATNDVLIQFYHDVFRAASMVDSFFPGRPMDYKAHNGPFWEDFGNRNYGVVGTARGYSPEQLLRAAGFVQEYFGAYNPSFGHFMGNTPYGDDPYDQEQILQGIKYAQDKLK